METEHICVLIHICIMVRLVHLETCLRPPVKCFTDRLRRCFFCGSLINVISVLFSLHLRARLFIDALWYPAGKRLTSWLSFVISYCDCHFPIGILG